MALPALIGVLAPLVGRIIDRAIPDKEAAAKAKLEAVAVLSQTQAS